MTVETVSKILGITGNAVRHHITQGNLGAVRYGRAYEISPAAFIQFFEAWAPGADLERFLAGRDGKETQAAIKEIRQVYLGNG